MAKKIPVIERIMGANDAVALENRAILDETGTHTINLMASPGAGKTTFILKTLETLVDRASIGVIEGDLASSVDAIKVREAGAPAIQINTGGGCHLDAPQVQDALKQLDLADLDLVFIENVGNLVCPVGFALGEHTRVGISSVPEGDDKPQKYPTIFANIDVLVITKIDLLPYIAFDMDAFKARVTGLNPDVQIFEVCCLSGEGMDAWADWLLEQLPTA